jgi:hypothetical protein
MKNKIMLFVLLIHLSNSILAEDYSYEEFQSVKNCLKYIDNKIDTYINKMRSSIIKELRSAGEIKAKNEKIYAKIEEIGAIKEFINARYEKNYAKYEFIDARNEFIDGFNGIFFLEKRVILSGITYVVCYVINYYRNKKLLKSQNKQQILQSTNCNA